METYTDPYKQVVYCPMCQKIPARPSNPDLINLIVPVPRICLSCQAVNSTLTAEVRAAGKVKVRVIPPGVSGRKKEDHQKSMLNLTSRKKFKVNRSKNQPP